MRARTVGELAAQRGVKLEDLVRTPLFGMLAPDAPFSATFAWDMHHEHPVTTAEDLAGRRLLSYDGWSIDDDKPKVGLDAVGASGARRFARVQPARPGARVAALLGVAEPHARTVGVDMGVVEGRPRQATSRRSKGRAQGETYRSPGDGRAPVAEDRVRFIPRELTPARARERLAEQARIGRGGEAAVGEPVDAAAQRPAGRRSGTGPAPSTRIVGEPGKPLGRRLLLGLDLAHGDRDAGAERRAQLGERLRVRRAAVPVQERYFHLTEQPTGFVSGLATGRPASTSSSASRSHSAFSDSSPWSASGAPR